VLPANVLPALHSHATRPHATVEEVLQGEMDHFLQPRRTEAATEERNKLALLLAPVQLRRGDDVRICRFQKKDGGLGTSSLYKGIRR